MNSSADLPIEVASSARNTLRPREPLRAQFIDRQEFAATARLSSWQMQENEVRSNVFDAERTYPHLSDLDFRTLLLGVASNLTWQDMEEIIIAYKKVVAFVRM
jgi:hypothetical protein